MVHSLTSTQEKLLEALATYRYMTADQMVKVGVSKGKPHLYEVLASLLGAKRKPKEIGELDFGVRVGQGRLPRLYYLTKRGAELLELAQPDLPAVPFVARATKFNNDYIHRVHMVDCHIALRQYAEACGHEVRWFKTYFDFSSKRGARPRPATEVLFKGGSLVPDALAVLDCADSIERLFAIEVANGWGTGRVEKQLLRYCEAIADEGAWSTFDVKDDTDVRVVYIFEHARELELVRERLIRERVFAQWQRHFFARELETVRTEAFGSDWMHLATSSANRVELFAGAAQSSVS